MSQLAAALGFSSPIYTHAAVIGIAVAASSSSSSQNPTRALRIRPTSNTRRSVVFLLHLLYTTYLLYVYFAVNELADPSKKKITETGENSSRIFYLLSKKLFWKVFTFSNAFILAIAVSPAILTFHFSTQLLQLWLILPATGNIILEMFIRVLA